MLSYTRGRHPLLARQKFETLRPATKSETTVAQGAVRKRAQLEWSAFDVASHQRIALLFSCHLFDPAADAYVACVHPWTIIMHFYGRHDLTLGHFLESYLSLIHI